MTQSLQAHSLQPQSPQPQSLQAQSLPISLQRGALAQSREAERHSQLLLTFQLNGETLAVEILAIKEIIEYGSITSVPLMPDYIRGVINLRGAVVPVIDLAVRFNRLATGVTRRSCIVIVEIRSGDEVQDVGVIVDAVNEVVDIPSDTIRSAPSFGVNIRAEFIRGMAEIDGSFVIILNVDQVLCIAELARLSPQAGNAEAAEPMRA